MDALDPIVLARLQFAANITSHLVSFDQHRLVCGFTECLSISFFLAKKAVDGGLKTKTNLNELSHV